MNKVVGINALIIVVFATCFFRAGAQNTESKFVSFITPASDVRMFWKDPDGKVFGSLQRVKTFVESKGEKLIFAMNGGMYKSDNSPQGLFIELGTTQAPLDTLSGSGNFYLMPNGVFYITDDNSPSICQTGAFAGTQNIKFATQSGPMLLIDGEIHPAFKKGSSNLNIRNGVGILPDNRIVFIMSRQEVNFYDFAMVFRELKCKNALYLDGFVSRTYFPAGNSIQMDGNFGVIIGVAK